ncbi:helix-turn-helix transcriptional regulator [Kushneria sp. AK178]
MEAFVTVDEKGRRRVASPCVEPCAIETGMRILGGKWTGSLLWHINDGPVRFNDLARMVGGASKKMITERLRFLEAKGLISRHVRDTSPVIVEYAITPLGETAIRVLDELREWSEALPADVLEE